MNVLYSLVVIGILYLIALLGESSPFIFGVVIPYIAVAVFVIGLLYRVIKWARSPVPFRIPTTAGQQKSLPMFKANNLESPYNIWGVLGRMFLEVLFFRSLFRNTKAEINDGPHISYGSSKFLWLGGLAFHWSLLIIVLRHFRFFTEPVMGFVHWLQAVDGFFEMAVPVLYMTDIVILTALTYLVGRRIFNPQVRFISLMQDYFAVILILAIAVSGVWMRYIDKVNLIKVKELSLGLVSFNPVVPEGIGAVFFVHLFFVSVLLLYFPFSKLLHAPGVFFSPTRNLANNNRIKRHVNPWNPKVKVHTYQEWEDDFRDKIKTTDIPLEKE